MHPSQKPLAQVVSAAVEIVGGIKLLAARISASEASIYRWAGAK